jgi:hypothetical protein
MGCQLNKENLQPFHRKRTETNSTQLKTNSTQNQANQ